MKEALKLALEALEKYCTPYNDNTHPADDTITAIKQALNDATPLAAPDTLTNSDGETPEYVNGWNDCRQLMMEMIRKESK